MINQRCKKCTFLAARALVDGKLQWGEFCTLPAYRHGQAAVEIRAGHVCPLVEDAIPCEITEDKPGFDRK